MGFFFDEYLKKIPSMQRSPKW